MTLRLVLEDLGVTSIKIGQILSTRPDVLPPEYEQELSKLQDASPPEPFATIAAVIRAELGRPVDELFARFDPVPLATGSIGQAHTACRRDGTEVVVKVRRPGVTQQVAIDLEILEGTASLIARVSSGARRHDVAGLAQEFAGTLRAELSYLREAANSERIAAAFAGDPAIRVPRVYRDQTTNRVITLERLAGLKLDDLAGLDAAGIDRVVLARRAAGVVLKMVFEDGFFHADPHPGNFFVEADGRIGMIDFGMVGTLDRATRRALVQALVALVSNDASALEAAITRLGMVDAELDRDALAVDLNRLVAEHLDHPLAEVRIGRLLYDMLTVLRRHRMHMPRDLALLAKTFAMCEGVAAQLDPSFRMAPAIIPYVQGLASDGVVPPPGA